MKHWLLRFHRDHSAVSAIEYALLGALISVVIVGAVAGVGTQLQSLFAHVKDQVVHATK